MSFAGVCCIIIPTPIMSTMQAAAMEAVMRYGAGRRFRVWYSMLLTLLSENE